MPEGLEAAGPARPAALRPIYAEDFSVLIRSTRRTRPAPGGDGRVVVLQ
jgi:hypothetical protein